MTKTADNSISPSNAIQGVKFSNSFTPEVDTFIKECEQQKITPTVKGFANKIGTDVFSLWQWANKKKKDEQGNIIEELARPNFHVVLTKLDKIEKDAQVERLNPQQELFCRLYATEREFFGNGTQSYIEAYEPDQSKPNWYRGAQASASRLLSNVIILNRINELLEDMGLNDAFVDKQMALLITQNADYTNKLGAIREYNKLRQRVTEKINHLNNGKDFEPARVVGFNFISPERIDELDNSKHQANA